ncbi:MAG: TRAP transporter substrate-binding protein [Geminicoccaceae bacterium]|nr:TRAP transporter substrate-binding protein [Geminicoccaceae bacterium]
MRTIGAVIAAAALFIAGGAGAAETWRIQTALPTAHPVHKATERWAEDVGRMTAGRLRVEILPGGAVVPPADMIDAVGQGILDGMATSSVYFTGRDRAFALLGDLIGGYQDWATALAFCEYGGGKQLYRELYAAYGAYTIGCPNSGVESLVSSKPIRSPADFKGVKIRAPEGMAASLFRKMGASPVALPPTEVFTAIDKKVVDGADYSSYAMNHSLGFHKIAKYPILHFHSLPVYEVTVNKAKWDTQPDDVKAILEMSVRDLAVRINLEDMIAERAAIAADKAAGVEPIVWSPEHLAEMRRLAAEVWAEYAQASPMARKAFEAHKAFLEKLGLLQ